MNGSLSVSTQLHFSATRGFCTCVVLIDLVKMNQVICVKTLHVQYKARGHVFCSECKQVF